MLLNTLHATRAVSMGNVKMKIGVRGVLIVAGIIWIIIILSVVLFGLCNVQCKTGARCGCALSDLFCYILVLGIPSWITFLVSLGVEDEEHGEKVRKGKERKRK